MIAKRIDANQNEIVESLRQIPGVTVQILSAVGKGCPDILVGYKARNYLFELKDGKKAPSERKLTDDEKTFFNRWSGQAAIAENLQDILTILNIKL